MWDDIVQALGPGAIVATAIFGLFVKADDFVSPQFRELLAGLIQRTSPPSRDSAWAQTFVVLFDRIFGTRPLSLRFIGRSLAASFLAVAVMWIIWLWNAPDPDFWMTTSTLIVAPLVINSVPDYLSLVESRWIVARMRGRGARATCALLLLDAILTALIFYVFVSLVVIVLVAMMEPDQAIPLDPLQIWLLLTEGGGLALAGDTTIGVFFYSTYFTSVWVWLYVASRSLLRLLAASAPLLRALKFVLPIEQKPLRAIGTAAYIPALAVSGAVWLVG